MRITVLAMALALLAPFGIMRAQDEGTKPDNTKVNRRDRNKSEVTADQQKDNRDDRQIAKDIRRAIVKDKSLSTYAHNIKIIAENGGVTLKGPVRSEEEKRTVEAKAAEIAGHRNVKSEISIAPSHEADRAR